mmetsp:Transcript_13712/g.30753  ORF Transcript_13712/g.30753 Transcript_13712/m.30753 type:complete len:243 (-) Transcript_13712:1464-2192(-)
MPPPGCSTRTTKREAPLPRTAATACDLMPYASLQASASRGTNAVSRDTPPEDAPDLRRGTKSEEVHGPSARPPVPTQNTDTLPVTTASGAEVTSPVLFCSGPSPNLPSSTRTVASSASTARTTPAADPWRTSSPSLSWSDPTPLNTTTVGVSSKEMLRSVSPTQTQDSSRAVTSFFTGHHQSTNSFLILANCVVSDEDTPRSPMRRSWSSSTGTTPCKCHCAALHAVSCPLISCTARATGEK